MIVDDDALLEEENVVDLILLVIGQPLLGAPDEDIVEEERVPLQDLLAGGDLEQGAFSDVPSSWRHQLKGLELLAKVTPLLDSQNLLLALHKPPPLVHLVDDLLNKLLRLFDVLIVGMIFGCVFCNILKKKQKTKNKTKTQFSSLR